MPQYKLFILQLVTFFSFSTLLKFDLSSLNKGNLSVDIEPFYLKKVVIDSDVRIDTDEILYLTGFKTGKEISSKTIEEAVFYLYLKNNFKSVSLDISDNEIHMKLSSFWCLNRVSVSGLLFGKHNVLQRYGISVGDRFDFKRHILSLQKIKKYLHSEGYFNSKVTFKLKKNYFNKAIDVDIRVRKGKKFYISLIEVCSDEKHFIEDVFNKYLANVAFNAQKIGDFLRKSKIDLLNKGIFASNLNFKFLKNNSLNTVKILVNGNFKKLRKIIFKGNNFFSDEQLLSHIYSREWFLSDFFPGLMIDYIKKLYKKNGFLNVDINFSEDENKLNLNIQENERTIVESIDIFSNYYSESFLRNKFFKKILSRYYNSSAVSKALQDLIDFYNSDGFWDASIVSTDICANGTLIIRLNEGDRKFLSDVKICGFSQFDKKIPYGNLNKCIPFDSKIIDTQKKWLTIFFKNIGYKNFEFIPELKNSENAINLEWNFVEKKTDFTFGKSVVRGNVKVPFQSLCKEFAYKEFDCLNKEDIDTTFNRLKGINGFESVHITPSKFLTSDNSNPILINLVNLSKFELHARLGFQQVNNSHILNWKSRSTYKLGGSFLLRNPLNIGDSLKVDADFTIFYRHLVAQYNLPWLFTAPVRTIMRFYGNKFLQPLYLGSNDIVYGISQAGGLSAFNYKYKSSNMGSSLGGEALKVTQMSDKVAKAIDFSIDLINKRLPFIFCEPTFLVENVDNKINPTRGISLFGSLKASYSPFSSENVSYVRLLIENSIFYPLDRNVVFATRNRFGHIFINNLKNLLPSERFYLGGSNSVRSYEPDFAPPLGVFQEDGREQLFPTGSKTMFNSNIELRFKVFKSMGVVFFQDIGFLDRGNLDLRKDKVVTATGLGLRYFTPIGPLRFDIGWRPRRFENDNNFAWYLTLGQSF